MEDRKSVRWIAKFYGGKPSGAALRLPSVSNTWFSSNQLNFFSDISKRNGDYCGTLRDDKSKEIYIGMSDRNISIFDI